MKTELTSQQIEAIELAKREILEWYGINVSDDRVLKFLVKTDFVFDTIERSDLINELSMEMTGMSWPLNGDSGEYKKTFYKKLKEYYEGLGNNNSLQGKKN